MTEEEYLDKLVRIYDLMDALFATPEGLELDRLVDEVRDYEAMNG